MTILAKKILFKKLKQRYCCNNDRCKVNTFLDNYTYRACSIDVKSQIVILSMNGSGIRDISRVLKILPVTVINEFKKKENLISNINYKILNKIDEFDLLEVNILLVKEVELNEMWSYVGNKKNRHWLWHDIDHKPVEILA